MRQIDFLPPHYRQQYARRQWMSQQVAIVLAFVLLFLGLWGSQYHARRVAQRDLADLKLPYERAQQQCAKLAELQTKLKEVQATAELYTYLRHPWPRTQLLSAILAPLPESIVFQEVKIVREAGREAPERAGSQPKGQQPKGSPSAETLKQLRQRYDRSRMLVNISGVTKDPAELHRYLGVLSRNSLFTGAELINSATATGNNEGGLRFSAILTVRPGYGQPAGPEVAAASQPNRNENPR